MLGKDVLTRKQILASESIFFSQDFQNSLYWEGAMYKTVVEQTDSEFQNKVFLCRRGSQKFVFSIWTLDSTNPQHSKIDLFTYKLYFSSLVGGKTYFLMLFLLEKERIRKLRYSFEGLLLYPHYFLLHSEL